MKYHWELNDLKYKYVIFVLNLSKEMKGKKISVIIPAHNEEKAISKVLNELPSKILEEIVVVNNNSHDKTAILARSNGATVIDADELGYGNACLTGIQYLKTRRNLPDIVVFLDGDHSDYPEQLTDLVQPILDDKADLVIGSRTLGKREKGSLTIPQVFGNWLATRLMKLFFNVKFTDLGPFRAIRFSSLLNLGMVDRNYGWTVEMQLKAARKKIRCAEIPVNYRNRIGVSKVSGTVKGSIMAGYKILFTIFRYI